MSEKKDVLLLIMQLFIITCHLFDENVKMSNI